MIARPPGDAPPVPEAVRALAAGDPVRAVWRNERGGITFQLGEHRFAKWAPAGSGLDLAAEAQRLAWAAPFTPVPRVLACDALPVEACPFSWSAEDRLAVVHHRSSTGSLDPAGWSPDHRHLTPEQPDPLLPAALGPLPVIMCDHLRYSRTCPALDRWFALAAVAVFAPNHRLSAASGDASGPAPTQQT